MEEISMFNNFLSILENKSLYLPLILKIKKKYYKTQ